MQALNPPSSVPNSVAIRSQFGCDSPVTYALKLVETSPEGRGIQRLELVNVDAHAEVIKERLDALLRSVLHAAAEG